MRQTLARDDQFFKCGTGATLNEVAMQALVEMRRAIVALCGVFGAQGFEDCGDHGRAFCRGAKSFDSRPALAHGVSLGPDSLAATVGYSER